MVHECSPVIKETGLSSDNYFTAMVEGKKIRIPVRRLSEQKTFFAICFALDSDEIEISTGAALALGKLKDKRALPFLLKSFLTTNLKQAQAVAWALGELKDTRALPFLIEALDADFISQSVIVALGKIGSLQALETFFRLLDERDEKQRALIVKAIGQLSFEHEHALKREAVTRLMKCLEKEKSRAVRLTICVTSARLEKF
ncbi:MAG: HEAT repeat domain-containing protein [Myxococcales bacterium]|nr:HEAT repeat domain-containing protein [Myxococcales bacterium]USN51554.1 MAG: HEAT repeat domain-containing protein [Myxococcales bacterium]